MGVLFTGVLSALALASAPTALASSPGSGFRSLLQGQGGQTCNNGGGTKDEVCGADFGACFNNPENWVYNGNEIMLKNCLFQKGKAVSFITYGSTDPEGNCLPCTGKHEEVHFDATINGLNLTVPAGDCTGAPVCIFAHDGQYKQDDKNTAPPEDCFSNDNQLCAMCGPVKVTPQLPKGADCNDHVPCTHPDVCGADGTCAGTPDDANCDDEVDCTSNTCKPGAGDDDGCVFTEVDKNCDDEVGCTNDTCDLHLGCQFEAMDGNCNDHVDCTDDSCDAAKGCISTTNDSNCKHPKPCEIADSGVCTSSGCKYEKVICNTPTKCQNDDGTCIADSGECKYTDKTCPAAPACKTSVCDVATGCSDVADLAQNGQICSRAGCSDAACSSGDCVCIVDEEVDEDCEDAGGPCKFSVDCCDALLCNAPNDPDTQEEHLVDGQCVDVCADGGNCGGCPVEGRGTGRSICTDVGSPNEGQASCGQNTCGAICTAVCGPGNYGPSDCSMPEAQCNSVAYNDAGDLFTGPCCACKLETCSS